MWTRSYIVVVILVSLARVALGAAAEPALTLRAALDLSRARSPVVAAKRAQSEGARAAARVAGRLADPSLLLSIENWRPWAESFVARTDLDAFAVLTQPLDLFTRSGRRAEARGEREEAEAGQRLAEQAVVLETVQRYLETLRGRELVRALEAQSETLGELVVAMQRRVAEGRAAEADLLRFRAEAAHATNQLVRARVEMERAAAELSWLIGRSVRDARLAMPALPVIPADEADVLTDKAIAQRPDVLAARAQLARAEGRLRLERARRYPDLSLSGGYKRTGGLDTAVVGIVTSLPIFARNGREVALAEAEVHAATAQLASVLRRAQVEAATLVRAARTLRERVEHLDAELVQPAQEARSSALVAFREGAVDVLRVVDAERLNAEARREALELTVEAFLAGCRARLAAGLEVVP